MGAASLIGTFVEGRLGEQETRRLRADVFGHLAGLVVAPTVKALSDCGVLKLLDRQAARSVNTRFEDLVHLSHANPGYLRVALRLLAGCGWLRQLADEDGSISGYSLTASGELALGMAPHLYGRVLPFIPSALSFRDALAGTNDGAGILDMLRDLSLRARRNWAILPSVGAATDDAMDAVQKQLRRHLDGLILGPLMVALSRLGILDRIAESPIEVDAIRGNAALLRCAFSFLDMRDWAVFCGDQVQLTPRGCYAAKIAASYGVTVSYLPTLSDIGSLLFGNPHTPRFGADGVELLVDRDMNVWGSGGAHKTYFSKVDDIIIDIFNRPLASQPKGICDMGCGDATFLEHLYLVVKQRTLRGRSLATHPLIMVGADYNKVARQVSENTLRQAGIPVYHVIDGDINRPADLAAAFGNLGLDMRDFFHVRSFLDHNRPYVAPTGYVSASRKARTTGVFANRGAEIPADEMEENLVQHLRRWAEYVDRFGLLIIELHTLPPQVTARNLDRTAAVAYDGTHGYSDQYIIELPVFLDCAREAGLIPDLRYQAKFPPSDLATVSINLFVTSTPSDSHPVSRVGRDSKEKI